VALAAIAFWTGPVGFVPWCVAPKGF